jgi:hypothetical protein
MFHYASKMTDHVEKSTKSASCIQMSLDKIMSPSCWHWVGMSWRQNMLKSSKMDRVTLICKGNSTSNLTCFMLKLHDINNKIFFSQQTCLFGDYLASGQIHFPLADLFIRGSSCMLIDMILLSRNTQQVAVLRDLVSKAISHSSLHSSGICRA